MNKERTFGIEIETHSRLSRSEIKNQIAVAFREAGIDHHCITAQYGHDTSQTNFTHWSVKSDTSITRRANSSITSTHPVGAEIVSPILRGEEGLKALEIVCTILDTDDFRVSKTCGLHVHHGVNRTREKIYNFINSWINIEGLVMKVLPPSRQNNHYCKTWKRHIADQIFDTDLSGSRCPETLSPDVWWTNKIDTRYANVNLGSLRMRNTIEFRLHSGTVEFVKIKNWLIWTQALVDCSLRGEIVADSFDALMEKIKLLSGGVEETPTPEVSLFTPGAKKQKLPRAGTKLRLVADMVLEGKRKDQIVRALNEKFGRNTKAHRVMVTCNVSDFKTLKFGFGWDITKQSDGRYKVNFNQPEQPEPVVSNGECPADIKKACQWMVDRFELFSS